MKILFLTNIPSPYRVLFFNELSKYCNLTVLYESECEKSRDKNWKVEISENYNSFFLKGIEIGKGKVICTSVTQYLKDKSYDIIVIGGYATPTGMLAVEYLNYKKIQFLLNSDGGFIKEDGFAKYRIKRHFISSAYRWLSSGKPTSDYLMHYGAKKERIFQYPFTSLTKADILSQPLAFEEKQSIKSSLGLKEGKIAISVGQFIYRKGFDILINAWAKLEKKYHLLIIGGGEKKQEYENLLLSKGLTNIEVMDFMDKSKLFEYYKACDLFILPTREDIWGLVINEAMACGLPVITTDRCMAGLKLVENGENGFIVPVGDEKKLADKINVILSNDKLKNNMSQKSLEKIEPYTIENMAQRHMKVFTDILGSANT